MQIHIRLSDKTDCSKLNLPMRVACTACAYLHVCLLFLSHLSKNRNPDWADLVPFSLWKPWGLLLPSLASWRRTGPPYTSPVLCTVGAACFWIATPTVFGPGRCTTHWQKAEDEKRHLFDLRSEEHSIDKARYLQDSYVYTRSILVTFFTSVWSCGGYGCQSLYTIVHVLE